LIKKDDVQVKIMLVNSEDGNTKMYVLFNEMNMVLYDQVS